MAIIYACFWLCVDVCRCYDCDDEVGPDSTGKLQECVDFVRKQAGLAPKVDAQASQGMS